MITSQFAVNVAARLTAVRHSPCTCDCIQATRAWWPICAPWQQRCLVTSWARPALILALWSRPIRIWWGRVRCRCKSYHPPVRWCHRPRWCRPPIRPIRKPLSQPCPQCPSTDNSICSTSSNSSSSMWSPCRRPTSLNRISVPAAARDSLPSTASCSTIDDIQTAAARCAPMFVNVERRSSKRIIWCCISASIWKQSQPYRSNRYAKCPAPLKLPHPQPVPIDNYNRYWSTISIVF